MSEAAPGVLGGLDSARRLPVRRLIVDCGVDAGLGPGPLAQPGCGDRVPGRGPGVERFRMTHAYSAGVRGATSASRQFGGGQ